MKEIRRCLISLRPVKNSLLTRAYSYDLLVKLIVDEEAHGTPNRGIE